MECRSSVAKSAMISLNDTFHASYEMNTSAVVGIVTRREEVAPSPEREI